MKISINEIIKIKEMPLKPPTNVKRTTKQILDSIDFAEIEKYVRNKKLKNLNEERER